jgi:uncharacterized protein (TIGR03083 family)
LSAYLAADVDRLCAVADGNLAAPVPSCPGWTVRDLVHHVANGYVNVVLRRLRLPHDLPVQELDAEHPIAELRRCYAALTQEFRTRSPDETLATGTRETVQFWIRRMAHETVIHRVDAEQALGAAPAPIPDDLAEDGVGEMLWLFLDYETYAFPEDYAGHLVDWGGRSLRVSAGTAQWLVTLRADAAQSRPTSAGDAHYAHYAHDADVQASIAGEPTAVLLWLYRRGDDQSVQIDGDTHMIGQFRRLLLVGTSR